MKSHHLGWVSDKNKIYVFKKQGIWEKTTVNIEAFENSYFRKTSKRIQHTSNRIQLQQFYEIY